MLAFSRLASFLLFVLSLSFLACAAPTAVSPNALAIRDDDVAGSCLAALVELKVKLEAHVEACASLVNIDAAQTLVATTVADINIAAGVVGKLAVDADVSADIKAKIAAELALIIQAIVKICASLVAKLGATIALSLCVQVDACIKLLLLSVDVCISGVVALCAKLLVDIDASILLKLDLDLCAQVLGLVKVTVLGAVNIAI